MLPAQRSPWQDPRVLSILLMVFLAGAFSGALVMRAGTHWRSSHSASSLKDSDLTLARLQHDLNLTPDQSEKLKSILDDMVNYRQEIESYRATGKYRILAILTPEQRKRFEELSRNMQVR
jgi:Spy/CpxP family protein refolding chaperone